MHSDSTRRIDPFARKANGADGERMASTIPPNGSWHAQAVQERFERGRDLIRQGYPAGNVFLIVSGWAMRHRILENGTRQILSFVLPGDLVGIPGMYVKDSLYTVTALTELSVLRLPQSAIVATAARDRELAAQVLMLFTRESLMLAEHLTELGRKSAYDRVGHLLLELHHRSSRGNGSGPQLHWMPITQEMIGDAVGLSAVHVSRTLTRLRSERLVDAKPGAVAVRDAAKLAKSTGYESEYIVATEALRHQGSALTENLVAGLSVPMARNVEAPATMTVVDLGKGEESGEVIGLGSSDEIGNDTLQLFHAKRGIFLQLLEGESISAISGQTGIPQAQLEIWRLRAQVALNAAIALPDAAELYRDLESIHERIDELGNRIHALERRTCM